MAEHLPFVVEPMTVADLPAVMDIERRSFSAPWSERAYRYEIEENRHGVVVVVRQPPPAGAPLAGLLRRLKVGQAPARGYGGLWLLVDEAHISTIAVHPAWRGRGLGELVLLGLLDQGARRGAQMATLEVRASNHVAQGLYEKYWFEVTGHHPRYYSDNNEDALIMATPLFTLPEFQENLARNRAALHARLLADAARDSART